MFGPISSIGYDGGETEAIQTRLASCERSVAGSLRARSASLKIVAINPDDLYRVSREEYLVGELLASARSEWVDGVVYAMAGAAKTHVRAVSRINRLLFDQADERGCLLGSSDLLVETALAFYYPDIVLSCQPSDDPRIEHNPCFIAEVLSPSTGRVDRHEKRDAYCALASLQDYWIVDAETKVIEAWTRGADGWVASHYSAAELVRVQCLDLEFRVADIVGA